MYGVYGRFGISLIHRVGTIIGLILFMDYYIQINIFWLCRDRATPWALTSTLWRFKCLAQVHYMSCIMRKPDYRICEKTYQVCSKCTVDQRLCFRLMESTIPLLLKSESSKFLAFFCGCTNFCVLTMQYIL